MADKQCPLNFPSNPSKPNVQLESCFPFSTTKSASAFCLKLPHHESELHYFIGQLFDDDSFKDVILMVDDGQSIKAHKLILCLFSTYFKQVLSHVTVPYHYPVVIVKDTTIEDLKSLVEYIYRGQATVTKDRLPFVLKTAKELKIRGLF